MTGWTEVSRKRKKMVQIFVKVDGGMTSAMEMEMNDKVDDIVKKIPISAQDVYVTSGGRILKGGDKLKSCEVRDGSIVEAKSRMWWRQAQGQEEQSGEETRHEAGAIEKRGSGDSGNREGGSDPDV